MKYLGKTSDSKIIREDLTYSVPSQRGKIRLYLLEEQKGFCAYTEKYICETDSYDIEHFDPAKKGSPDDGYHNWYAVRSWINQRKPRKKDEVMLLPYAEDVARRIKFDSSGLFVVTNPEDIEAKNLLAFIGINRPEVYRDREKHVERIRSLKSLCGTDDALFFRMMAEHKDYLSYASALECILGIDLTELI